VDGLLSFWVLSAVFAVVGAALKGLIRPLSWATLAIATLFIAPGKVAETVNAVRAGEVKLALPSLPPPPSVPPATSSPSTNGNAPVQLDPNAAPTTTITTPPPAVSPANKGWTAIDKVARGVLPAASGTTRPPGSDSNISSDPYPELNPTPIPAPDNSPSRPPVSALW
jgi:hypothetical protein